MWQPFNCNLLSVNSLDADWSRVYLFSTVSRVAPNLQPVFRGVGYWPGVKSARYKVSSLTSMITSVCYTSGPSLCPHGMVVRDNNNCHFIRRYVRWTKSYTFQGFHKIIRKIQALINFLVIQDFWVLGLYPLLITGSAYVPIISWGGETATAQLSLPERAVLNHWTSVFLSDSAQ